MRISVQREDFDLGAEVKAISGNPRIGAVASFVGLVRDVPMTLEHYPGMTERALDKIVAEAKERFKVYDALIIHRVGELRPTDQIVLAVASGAHRGEVFAACEFIVDYLKTRAPFWKKESTQDGTRWVEARETDDQAAARWEK